MTINKLSMILLLLVFCTPILADNDAEKISELDKGVFQLKTELNYQKKEIDRLQKQLESMSTKQGKHSDEFNKLKDDIITFSWFSKWNGLFTGLLGFSFFAALVVFFYKKLPGKINRAFNTKIEELANGRSESLEKAIENSRIETQLIQGANVLFVRNGENHRSLNLDLTRIGFEKSNMKIINYDVVFDVESSQIREADVYSNYNFVVFDGFKKTDGDKIKAYVDADDIERAYLVYIEGYMDNKPSSVNTANTKFSLYYRILETLFHQYYKKLESNT